MTDKEQIEKLAREVNSSPYYSLSRDEMWEKNIELDVENKYLKDELARTKKYIDNIRKEWEEYKKYLEFKYPLPEGADVWEFRCEHHRRIQNLLDIAAGIKCRHKIELIEPAEGSPIKGKIPYCSKCSTFIFTSKEHLKELEEKGEIEDAGF